MAYFPAFLKLDNLDILVVGGGKIASDKVSKLLDFTKQITIISPKINKRMKNLIKDNKLTYKENYYQKGDINHHDIVIVAVDDIEVQKMIYIEAKKRGILCNSVDSIDYCDFIFPSYIKDGDLTIAISTSGSSPAVSKHLKRYIKDLIPSTLTDFLSYMKRLRANIKKGEERMKLLDKKAKEYFENYKDKG